MRPALADLARSDREAPYLEPGARAALPDAAIGYFIAIHDYRGLDDRDGWRRRSRRPGIPASTANPIGSQHRSWRWRDAYAPRGPDPPP
ncbi:MAG: DUF2785 domain-containing protein [Gammaproteobacteria bacterium]|nr:DUF2785 domain-containing protein [Gammaproteobacteria bacterium]